tara:strand:+ start:1770 stop:2624 length:855 start_codon:yes stop_codon:yes gene_type:complete
VKETKNVRVYTPNVDNSVFSIFIEGLKNLYSSHFLAYQIAKRDISAQYRQSFLGLIWSVVLPLSTAAVWIFMKNSNTVSLSDTGIYYPVFVFTGTMAWAILTETIMGTINVTQTMRSTLSKINFPKEALITAGIYKTLFNVFIKLIILSILLIVFKQNISWSISLFPFALFMMILFGTSIGLLITPIGLLYGDVGKLMTPFMQVLMYFSPVVFVLPSYDNVIGRILYYNPLTPLVNNFRNLLVGQNFEQVSYYISIGIGSFLLFCIALIFYKITIPIITERIGG